MELCWIIYNRFSFEGGNNNMSIQLSTMGSLLKKIKEIIFKARYKAVYSINQEMLNAYFEIGKRIVEEEQNSRHRADYGTRLLELLSQELSKEFGKGFSATNLRNMRLFYHVYNSEIHQLASDESKWKLTWSHYCELIKIDEPVKRKYLESYAAKESLSVMELKRQIYSLHYERLLISKNKKALIHHEIKAFVPQKPEEVIKDPYILEFLNLEEKSEYTEREMETKILNELQKFLLELGQGFSFVARQKRFTLDNDHFYIDLLFYNIYLKCYVVIELKTGKFKPEDSGQLNFYLNYVRKELNKEGDNEPIGIILCTGKDKVQVEFALSRMPNKLFVSKYKLYLPSKEELEREIKKLI